MKVKLLVGLAGAEKAYAPGDEYPCVSQAEATRLIDAGFAVPIATPKIERAVKAAPEKRKK